jgi:hypothetical protein
MARKRKTINAPVAARILAEVLLPPIQACVRIEPVDEVPPRAALRHGRKPQILGNGRDRESRLKETTESRKTGGLSWRSKMPGTPDVASMPAGGGFWAAQL